MSLLEPDKSIQRSTTVIKEAGIEYEFQNGLQVFGPKEAANFFVHLSKASTSVATLTPEDLVTEVPNLTDRNLNGKLVFLPQTMLVYRERGEDLIEPEERPVNIRNIFALFCDPVKAMKLSGAMHSTSKGISGMYPSPRALEAYGEARERFTEEIASKFEGTNVLNWGSLLDGIVTDKSIADTELSQSGWFNLKEMRNNGISDLEGIEAELNQGEGAFRYFLPAPVELALAQLIINSNGKGENHGSWYPTAAETTIKVSRTTPDKTESVEFPGRYAVTTGSRYHVGIARVRADISDYYRNIIGISEKIQ